MVEVEGGLIRKIIYKSDRKGKKFSHSSKVKSSIFTALLFPDPHIDSFLIFYNTTKDFVKENHPDILITFAYPYTMHLVGYFIKKKFSKIIWIADYGDPWTDCPASELNLPNWRKAFDRIVERTILKRADLITVTTINTKQLYLKNFTHQKDKINVVSMGYDHDDFESGELLDTIDSRKITFVHTGRLYTEARNPNYFIEACYNLIKQNPAYNERMSIFFIGEIDHTTEEKINELELKNVIKYIPWVNMDESIRWMLSADYLLLFGNYGAVQIPGKLFQYIGSKRPILLFYETPEDPAISILKDLNNSLIMKNETDRIISQMEKILDGRCNLHKNPSKADIEKYSWEFICKEFDKKLKAIIAQRDLQHSQEK